MFNESDRIDHRNVPPSEELFTTAIHEWPRDGRATESELTKLRLVEGPGDDGESVMTILPNED